MNNYTNYLWIGIVIDLYSSLKTFTGIRKATDFYLLLKMYTWEFKKQQIFTVKDVHVFTCPVSFSSLVRWLTIWSRRSREKTAKTRNNQNNGAVFSSRSLKISSNLQNTVLFYLIYFSLNSIARYKKGRVKLCKNNSGEREKCERKAFGWQNNIVQKVSCKSYFFSRVVISQVSHGISDLR